MFSSANQISEFEIVPLTEAESTRHRLAYNFFCSAKKSRLYSSAAKYAQASEISVKFFESLELLDRSIE